tara:strand:+ start:478 stop:612 length:135 start_codon:yes stop_codon:yes gene_type:complete
LAENLTFSSSDAAEGQNPLHFQRLRDDGGQKPFGFLRIDEKQLK